MKSSSLKSVATSLLLGLGLTGFYPLGLYLLYHVTHSRAFDSVDASIGGKVLLMPPLLLVCGTGLMIIGTKTVRFIGGAYVLLGLFYLITIFMADF